MGYVINQDLSLGSLHYQDCADGLFEDGQLEQECLAEQGASYLWQMSQVCFKYLKGLISFFVPNKIGASS